ncbi:MAG: malonyl-CoA decarboxylase [Hyphomicrobiaceae bacterium]
MATSRSPINVSFLQELMSTVAEQGRSLLPRSLFADPGHENIDALASALISSRGEASGVAIARQIVERYRTLDPQERLSFFEYLGREMQPDATRVAAAARAYASAPSAEALSELQHAVESPRQEFFRRLNLAPGATAEIVAMRRGLLQHLKGSVMLQRVDEDLRHLLSSWFNRGFLVLRRIDWQTPASILEKIIAYEAVHRIESWDDLRRRLDARDRRCFAYFHPALVDEPLIFVEVALAHEAADAIQPILNAEPIERPIEAPTTAIFYSISNCQEGLKGISFGNFLIKQVVEDLVRELPTLKTFVTLSPVPGFARWLSGREGQATVAAMPQDKRSALSLLHRARWHTKERALVALREPLQAVAAHYFLTARREDGRVVDPVARFHLGNGARLERINVMGDVSDKGLEEAHGLMVNYRYDLKEIEKNHEAFANQGVVAASRGVKSLLKPLDAGKVAPGQDTEPEPMLALEHKAAIGQEPASEAAGQRPGPKRSLMPRQTT